MMEIGSFIELDLRNTGEYYRGKKNVARLNSARAGIYHACKLYGCNSVYIPYYLCPTVKKFLSAKDIRVKHFYINNNFEPVDLHPHNDDAVLLVNYFGLLSTSKLKDIAGRYKNVIIDNSAAFYSKPVKGCYSVYSPRKFFGVPDGCYVIGEGAGKYTGNYQQDFSSPTASFLLKKIEYGTSNSYGDRTKNEERIDHSDIMGMSGLTRELLKNLDYRLIQAKRKKNFRLAHNLFKEMNLIDPARYIDKNCIPMVYPLVTEDVELDAKLRGRKIFVGRLWNHVLREVQEDTFEAKLSGYMVPLPIDQRYGAKELLYVHNIILNLTGKNSKHAQ